MTGLWTTLTTAARLLTEARSAFVLAALGVYLIGVGIVAFRWRLILRALGCRATFWDSLLTYSAGVFTGNVTPTRSLGADACRLALMRSRTDASLKAVTASVVYDRASEVPALALLGLFALVTLRVSRAPLAIMVFVVPAAFAAVPSIRRALTSRLTRWHDALVGVPIGRGTVAAAIGCSMVVWLEEITRLILIAAAFRVALTPSQAATLTMLRVASAVIPVPGGVGVVEGGLIAGLVWFGVPTETAAAITIVERAILYACGTCIGALSLMLLGGRRVLNRRAVAVATATTAAIVLLAAPAGAQPAVPLEYRAAISQYEATLRADPGNLALGAAYRQLIITHAEYDRAISFFKNLAKAHHDLASVALNLGFAYLDKVPVSGRIRQGLLGRDAIGAFGDAIKIEPSWLACYSRGLIDLFYDGIFNRARPAIADFEQALAIQHRAATRPYFVRTFMSLGDAYWKAGDLAHARAAWTDGLREFPGDPALGARLAAEGQALHDVIETGLNANIRQDTTLKEILTPSP